MLTVNISVSMLRIIYSCPNGEPDRFNQGKLTAELKKKEKELQSFV